MNEHKLYNDIERIVLNWRGFESDNEFTSAIFDEVNKHFAELEAALKLMIDTQDDWEKSVSKIIGKQPNVFNRAIDAARAALGEPDG